MTNPKPEALKFMVDGVTFIPHQFIPTNEAYCGAQAWAMIYKWTDEANRLRAENEKLRARLDELSCLENWP